MQVAIVVGSTRPNRVGPLIAKWLLSIIAAEKSVQNAQLSIVDISLFPLPSFNEPVNPMMVKGLEFTNSATVEWDREIARYDSYIVISPEYHSGIPGGLKNSIDFLYHSWSSKPVMIPTYGIFGGAQASQQLRQVLGVGCRMRVASVAPMLEFSEKNEHENNASPALFQALGGMISPQTFHVWNKEKQKILAGCHELLDLTEN